MLDSISARQELLMMIGQPVHVRATLSRLGSLPGRPDREEYATALLSDIHLDGVRAPISHAWIRLGPTGSARARKLRLRNVPVEMDAIVIAYRGGDSGQDIRLGIGEVSNFIAFHRGRWRTVARGRESVETDRGERISQSYVDDMLADLLHREQEEVMKELRAYAASHRIDRAVQAALERYFARGKPVTPGQLRHAALILGGSHADG